MEKQNNFLRRGSTVGFEGPQVCHLFRMYHEQACLCSYSLGSAKPNSTDEGYPTVP